jgi:PAT family beta-lactamase induction signal transducer AmpG
LSVDLLAPIRPYLAREPVAAFLLGISSGFPYAMIGATLTTRLAQDGIDKRTITAFALAFLVYNLKVFWPRCPSNGNRTPSTIHAQNTLRL